MPRSITPRSLSLCLVVGLSFSQTVRAEPTSLPATGSACGKVTSFDLVNGVQTAVATGRGSVVGKHINNVLIFFDFDTGATWGLFEIVSEDGSASVIGSFTGSFEPIPGTPLIAFVLTGTFEDGSGRLDGVSGGQVEVVAVENLATEEIEYDYSGKFEFDD